MKQRISKPVHPSLLSSYSISNEDTKWVIESVESAFRQTAMTWADSEHKSKVIKNAISQTVERRFKERFPSFDKEVQEHTARGRSSTPLIFLWLFFWPALVIASLPYVDLLYISTINSTLLSIIAVIVGVGAPWLWFRGFGWVSDWEIPDTKPKELIECRDAWLSSLRRLISATVDSKAAAKFYESTSRDPAVLKASVQGRWQPLGPRPVPPSQHMSPRDAEVYVAAYMKFYGATGVAVTRYSRDGGVDVAANLFVSQVKHQEAAVGVKALREFFGVAMSTNKTPLFFTKSGYTKDALEFAKNNAIPLFIYIPHLQSVNEASSLYIERGMESS